MSKADPNRVPQGGLTRRAVLAGVGGAAGLAAGGCMGTKRPTGVGGPDRRWE
ncbi:MAG: hypothetical protein IH796_04255 [Deltaproteobacteria bacterium]|nr:hypothetical protein [Deltaproteobacteria bacterium]